MGLNVSVNYLNIDIQYKIKINNLFKKISGHVSNLLGITNEFYFDVTITNSKQMQAINNLYRNINKHTDVLSFAFYDNDPKTNLLGEIFINWDDVNKQSKRNKTSQLVELSILFIHGLLHLLQYDHQDSENYKKMIMLQNAILKSIR